jgi:hypothetical protein
MTGWITTAALASSIALGGAAPAAADQSEYLRHLAPEYILFGEQPLLFEGYKVCIAIRDGMSSSSAEEMVQEDLAASVRDSVAIVAVAAVDLRC